MSYGGASPYAGRNSGNRSPYGSGPRNLGSEKVEEELAIHIKKALSPDETAPKQKHVRACMLYTHDIKGPGSFFVGLRTSPIMGDEIMTWKALITFHKVVREGHRSLLNEAQKEKNWLELLAKSSTNPRGYGALTKGYVQFLLKKLEYHQQHPDFLGTFDYEEYVTLRGIEDPNEGFQTIDDLIMLLDRLDAFQKTIFLYLGNFASNECKIAALVPLVEESYGIYQFLVSMLSAMHMIIGSVEVLGPLRDKFNKGHYALVSFYSHCSELRYLTSLISIPKIDPHAPNFLSKGPPTLQPKKAPPVNKNSQNEQDQFMRDLERQRKEAEAAERAREAEYERNLELQRQQERDRENELQRQQHELQKQLEMQRQQEMMRRQEEERLRMQQLQQQQQNMQQMEQNMMQQQYMEMARELENYKSMSYRDRSLAEESTLKMRSLENQLAQVSLKIHEADAGKDDIIRKSQDELAQWKQKYESLAKLYAQLRKEHLDLLTKFKDMKGAGGKIADEARKEIEKIRHEMRAKGNEVTSLLIDKDRLKNELDCIRGEQNSEIDRLKRDLQDAHDSLLDISKSKGAEVQGMLSRFNHEKAELESLNKSQQQMINDLRKRLDDLNSEAQRSKLATEEDALVLQSGLDQTLMALHNLQQHSMETEENLLNKLRSLELDQATQLNRMMDNIIQSCITKIDDAVYELQSPSHEGNQTASPEYVLSLLEKTSSACGDFGTSFIHFLQGGDQADAITSSNSFAHCIAQLLHNAKGVTRLAGDDQLADQIISQLKEGALCGKMLFERIKVSSLRSVEPSRRPEHINALTTQAQAALANIGDVFEPLVSAEQKLSSASDDIGDIVEQEMLNAARAIEEAARRLEELMKRPKEELHVHGSILSAALFITTAIANLIKCATASQQEIVAHGRGASTKGAFYKKNNKWSEGLISAAKAVAQATTYLVEGADGLVNGTHSLEQLIVAANEVSVATTQLVAAARVKAIPFSKTQDKLEEAAVSVRDATKLLVKAARDAAKDSNEKHIQSEIKSMNSHQFKVVEMEQQVKILELEKDLQNARFKLASIRKSGYAD